MELKHIDIAHLSVSPANMRAKGKTPDLTNILPSVRARGVLVPLIVRPNGSPDSYEIVAGKRRYHAALTVAQESGEAESLPCAISAAGDDASALEASLIENVARLDPDEVTRWESFTRLVREGRTPEDMPGPARARCWGWLAKPGSRPAMMYAAQRSRALPLKTSRAARVSRPAPSPASSINGRRTGSC